MTPEGKAAVEKGLRYLARTQRPDGSWFCKIGYKLNYEYRPTGEGSHVGVTALAGMAFLANGHLPGREQIVHAGLPRSAHRREAG